MLEEAVELICVSMNADEAGWAGETMEFYFACRKHGMDSSRAVGAWTLYEYPSERTVLAGDF